MKLLMIFCSEYLAETVRTALDDVKVECSAEVPQVLGAAGQFRRLDTPAFPGTANLFFVPVQDERVAEIRDRLAALLDRCQEERCIRIVALDIEPVL